MKVVRLKRGYQITLSDTEFDLISGLVSDDAHTYEGDKDAYNSYLSPQAKSAWTRRERSGGSLMKIDEDRR